jgi:hypothetical protein|tara:strand:- start:8732 stop:9040 length:309 start_codon:yes stop_codon:yes gene_type:complete
MGVDWLTCGICSENFPDCEEYYNCAKCENKVCKNCYDDQLSTYSKVEEDSDGANYFGEDALSECGSCTKSIIRDRDIVEYLLNKIGMTEEKVIEEMKLNKSE